MNDPSPYSDRRGFLAGLALAPRTGFAAPVPCPPKAWVKKGPVLNYPGESAAGWIQNFTSAAEPLSDGRWRLWCSLSGSAEIEKNIDYAEGVPGADMKFTWAALSEGPPDPSSALTVFNLPTGWRPVQAVHLKLKDGRHYRVPDPLRPCLLPSGGPHRRWRRVAGRAGSVQRINSRGGNAECGIFSWWNSLGRRSQTRAPVLPPC